MSSTKFLLADDSDAKILMLEGMIKKAQFSAEILIAKTTEEANQIISENNDIAFAFVDYEIPSGLGPAIIRKLKETNPHARIALVSSGNSEHYRENAEEAGAEAYICTSFGGEEVEAQIGKLLEEWETAL